VSHREVLESELRRFRLDLPTQQKRLLAAYCDELARWNKKMNLTGLSGEEMVRRLVVEPVWTSRQLDPSGVLADVGSGNGSPAIPIHIVSQLERTHLIEARAKRAVFLRHVTFLLKLEGVSVHQVRFKEASAAIGPVEWVTLQGVALTPEILRDIRRIATTTTTVVWITGAQGRTGLIQPYQTVQVPHTGTKILLFHVDLP
jgi:16S rRNA (guanine527-N7)-methyltransferase